MQKKFKQIPYKIVLMNGIEVSGKNQNVPFIIVDEKDTNDVPFLNMQNNNIKVSIVQGSMWIENVGEESVSIFFELPSGYLNLLLVEDKINFAVISDEQMKFYFSIDNIFKP